MDDVRDLELPATLPHNTMEVRVSILTVGIGVSYVQFFRWMNGCANVCLLINCQLKSSSFFFVVSSATACFA